MAWWSRRRRCMTSAIACPCPATTGCPASSPTRVTLAALTRPDPALIGPGGHRGRVTRSHTAPARAAASAAGRRAAEAVVSAWSQAASSIRVTGPRASGSSGRSRSKGVRPSRPASSMPGSTSERRYRRTGRRREPRRRPVSGHVHHDGRAPPAETETVRGTAAAGPREPGDQRYWLHGRIVFPRSGRSASAPVRSAR